MASGPDPRPPRLRRFTRTERILHWSVAITFSVMLATGLALYYPAVARYVDRPLAKEAHLWAAIAMGASMVLVPLLGNARSVLRSAREVQYLDADDIAWLKAGPIRQLAPSAPAPQGRFNAGQKLNTSIMSGAMTVLYVTGFLMWYGERDTTFRLAGAVPVHDVFTLLIVLLVTAHVYLALIHPATRASLRGMVTGEVDLEYAERHHPTWAAEQQRASAPEPSDRG